RWLSPIASRPSATLIRSLSLTAARSLIAAPTKNSLPKAAATPNSPNCSSGWTSRSRREPLASADVSLRLGAFVWRAQARLDQIPQPLAAQNQQPGRFIPGHDFHPSARALV